MAAQVCAPTPHHSPLPTRHSMNAGSGTVPGICRLALGLGGGGQMSFPCPTNRRPSTPPPPPMLHMNPGIQVFHVPFLSGVKKPQQPRTLHSEHNTLQNLQPHSGHCHRPSQALAKGRPLVFLPPPRMTDTWDRHKLSHTSRRMNTATARVAATPARPPAPAQRSLPQVLNPEP